MSLLFQITAESELASIQEAIALNVSVYIGKPFTTDIVQEILKKVFDDTEKKEA